MKKILSLIIAVMMIMGTMVCVSAADNVATIGSTGYATLADAVSKAVSGDVIVLENGEYELPLFSDKELTFKGVSKEGVIVNDAPYATQQGWSGSTFHFENLTAKGATENYHGLANGVITVTYTDCNINNLRFLYATDKVVFENCAFNANGVEHSFWTYGASNVIVNNCTFKYTDRAVNCYSESGANHETDISFTECSFEYTGTKEKPEGAVEINSGSVKSIDISFEECIAPENGAMWFNSQWDGEQGKNTIVEVDGETVWEVVTATEVSNYDELVAAIAAAADEDTILLTADIDYTGTSSLEIDKAVILDLGGNTLTTNGTYGGLRLKGNCSLKNGTLAHKGTVTAIKAWNVEAIEDVVIDVAFKAEGKTIGGIVIQEGSTNRIGTIKNVTIKGEGLTNGIETYNCGNATKDVIGSMENVTIDAKDTGMLISAPCGTASNCEIKGGTTGINLLLKGTYSATLGLVNCDVEGGTQALWVHDEGKGYNYDGLIKLEADDASTFKSENGEALKYEVANEEDAELSENIIALRPVVEVGEGKEYSTLNAAMEAVNGAKAEYHIYGEVTLETLFSHGDWTLGSVIGKTSDAKVTITGGGVTDLVSSSFKDITFADEGTYLPTANEFMYQNFENCTFENVVFEDAPRLSGTCTATNCTFNNSKDQKYALWMDEGSFTITGSAFVLKDIAYGTVKSDAAGSTLVLTNNTFINNSDSGKEALNTNGLIITATGNTFTDYTAGILPQDKTNTFNNETATGATVDDLVKKTNTVKTTPEVVVNWGTYTDAGFYTVSETEKAGMMRFLFAVDIYDEILETGIKYIKTANIEEEVDTATGVQGTESAFYGDVTGIPEGTDGTYLAVAYVKTAQGTYWSDVVECSPDFTKHFTEYQAQ